MTTIGAHALLVPSLVEKCITTAQAKLAWSKGTAPDATCPTVKRVVKGDMQQQTGSKSGKEHVEAVYGHRVYLTHTQR